MNVGRSMCDYLANSAEPDQTAWMSITDLDPPGRECLTVGFHRALVIIVRSLPVCLQVVHIPKTKRHITYVSGVNG